MDGAATPGFYGKVPAHGDFVSRRLPRDFIDPWDRWLQSAIAKSREQLQDEWLETYLTSPIWRFALSANVCGPGSWAGVLMPSVDKVGRYFPLTLAAPLAGCRNLVQLAQSADLWFQDAEAAVLSALEEEGLHADEIDERLNALDNEILAAGVDDTDVAAESGEDGESRIVHAPLASLDRLADSFYRLLRHSFAPRLEPHSLWWSMGSDDAQPCLLVSQGLPPAGRYSLFLQGLWAEMQGSESLVPDEPDIGSLVPDDGSFVAEDRDEDNLVLHERDDGVLVPGAHADDSFLAYDRDEHSPVPGEHHDDSLVLDGLDDSDLIPGDQDDAGLVADGLGLLDGLLEPQTADARVLPYTSASATESGAVREFNEDACHATETPDYGLWVVADGMGGHDSGDVASRMVVDALRDPLPVAPLEALVAAAEERLLEVNQRLIEMAEKSLLSTTIGSTVALLLAGGGRVACLWAGDSRVYRARDGSLEQLTTDHSAVEELIELGQLARADAESHPDGNVVTRAVGSRDDLVFDIAYYDQQPGDRYLVCSDGLYRAIDDAQLLAGLQLGDCEAICRTLMGLALPGATDNVTTVAVAFE